MTSLKTRISKYISSYMNPKLVLIMDVLLSLIASFTSVSIINIFAQTNVYSGTYAGVWILSAVIFSTITLIATGSYKLVIRHMTLKDMSRLSMAVLGKDLLMGITMGLSFGMMNGSLIFFVAFDFLVTICFLVGVRLTMVVVYGIYRDKIINSHATYRVLIYGTRTKAVSLVTRLSNSPVYDVIGLIAFEPVTKGTKLADKPVYYFDSYDDFKAFAEKEDINAVLFAHVNDVYAERDKLVQFCLKNGIKPLMAPSIDEVGEDTMKNNKVREIKIEDLLGRSEIKINLDEIKSNFGGKVVMVTGAAGSIGSELVRQLASFGVKKLVLFDNAETPMHNLRLELEDTLPDLDFVPIIGDVRIPERLDYAFRKWRPQVVFHAAAYKHVPLMEENPCEAVLVNVNGSRNVADKCIQYGVEKMVMISTDKAVNPTNIMGCTKRLAEIYVQSLGLAIENGTFTMPEGSVVDKPVTKFVTTRFGNVLGSNGSVIPRFREQIENGGPVTVTHPQITRFFMTIPEACRLVMEAATMSTGNQIYVFDMGKSVKIDTLARRMVELAGLVPDKDIKIEYTGLRPGEKLYEEVLSNAENTDPTSHDRIRVAKVRSYEYDSALGAVDELTRLSRIVNIPDMVRLMKTTVPEFKSKNSRFEVYDSPESSPTAEVY